MGSRELRQAKIVDLVSSSSEMTVAELADYFDVSAVTIRSDLQELERNGLLIRTLGGALPVRLQDPLEDFRARSSLRSSQKSLIGKVAASLIKPMDSVIIDAGSTTMEIVKHLGRVEPLTVVTPALNIAIEAAALPRVTVVLPGGGVLDPHTLSLTGTEFVESFGRLHVNKYFMGIRGVHPERGLTDTRIQNVRLKQAMMDAAKEVIVVADSSKLGQVSLVQVAPLKAVHAIVTDEEITPSVLEELLALEVQVHVARENLPSSR